MHFAVVAPGTAVASRCFAVRKRDQSGAYWRATQRGGYSTWRATESELRDTLERKGRASNRRLRAREKRLQKSCSGGL